MKKLRALALACLALACFDENLRGGRDASDGRPWCRVLNARRGETCTCHLEGQPPRGTSYYGVIRQTPRGLEACTNAPPETRIACRCGRTGTEERYWHDEQPFPVER